MELLVALTIIGIVTASITQMFTRMSFGYTTQTSHADLQQSVRAVLDLMTREIRMAGFTSHNVEGFGISRAEEDLVAFTVDWDDDGFVTPSHSDDPSIFFESDSITYTLNGEDKSLRRITAEDSASESSQSLLGGAGDWMQVAELSFAYFDEQERETDALVRHQKRWRNNYCGDAGGTKGDDQKNLPHQNQVQEPGLVRGCQWN